jgi:type III secretory pathway lipoprotein EscJ
MSDARILTSGLLVAFLSVSCTTRVVGGLDEVEANRVVMALEKAGIPASKDGERRGRDVSWSVNVPSGDGPRARQVLERLSLPRPPQEGFKGIAKEDSIVPSASREKLKETIARGEELARTLETLEGVVEASVIIAPASPTSPGTPPDRDADEGTASALLKVAGDPGITEEEVKKLVAGAVPGVDPAGVTVVIAQAPPPSPGGARWEKVGPFVVSSSSRTPLLLALVLMALLNLGLGAWAVASVVRRRRARQTPQAG